jgi:hypothetical protein
MSTTQTVLKSAIDLYRVVAGHVPRVSHCESPIAPDHGHIDGGAEGLPTQSNDELSLLPAHFLITSNGPGKIRYETILELRSKSDSLKADIAMVKANEVDALATIQCKEAAIDKMNRKLEHQSGSKTTKAQRRCLKGLLRERDAAAKTKREMQRLVKSLTKEYHHNLRSFAEVVMELQDILSPPNDRGKIHTTDQHGAKSTQAEEKDLVQEQEELQMQQDGEIIQVNNGQLNDSPRAAKGTANGEFITCAQPPQDPRHVEQNIASGNIDQQASAAAAPKKLESCLPKAKSINIAVDDIPLMSERGTSDRSAKDKSEALSIYMDDCGILDKRVDELQEMAALENNGSTRGPPSEEMQQIGIEQVAEEGVSHVDPAAGVSLDPQEKDEEPIEKLERCEDTYWAKKERINQHNDSFDRLLEEFCSINPHLSRAAAEDMFGGKFLRIGYNLGYALTVAEDSLKEARIEAKQAGVNNCNSWDQESAFFSVDGEGPEPENTEYTSDARDRELVMEWLQMPEEPEIMQPSEFKFATTKDNVDPWESSSSRGDSRKRRKIDQNVDCCEGQSSKAYSSKRRKIGGDVLWVTPDGSRDSTTEEEGPVQKPSQAPGIRPRARSDVTHKRRPRSLAALPDHDDLKGLFPILPVVDHSVSIDPSMIADSEC